MLPQQMAALVKFIEAVQPERLLIHCNAGRSRAPALAIVAAVHAGQGVDQVFATLAALPLRPNRRVLALGEAALGSPGDLVRQATATFDYDRPADLDRPGELILMGSGAGRLNNIRRHVRR